MKKITTAILFVLFAIVFNFTLASGDTLFNYPRLYRGLRSLGMGGAYTAVGGDIDAIFYNPAGLSQMPLRIEILNPLAEADEDMIDVGQDLFDAMDLETDIERLNEITRIISENQGKALHARVSVFPSVAYKNFALGVLGQGKVDARLHNALSGFGTVEVDGGVDFGPVFGFSFSTPVKGLKAGIGAKWIQRVWVKETFTAQQLASDSFDFSDYDTTNSDFSFDAGLLYDLPIFEKLKPKLGIALLDITDLDFKEGGKIPARLNVGVSISPDIPFASRFLLAVDYEDATHAFEEDGSFWKRVHGGIELGFLKNHLLLRGGINQGYLSAGAELDIWIIKLGYVYYSEEMGAYSGQDRDSRHLVKLTIGW